MKKPAVLFFVMYCIISSGFANFPCPELAAPPKFFSHKPFIYWADDKAYTSFTAVPFEENRLKVTFESKDSRKSDNIDFLKENFYWYQYYNPYKDNGRKVGDEIYFFIKKDEISYFLITSNVYEHYSKGQEDLKLLDFHYFSSDKKILKTVTEESLKPEAEKLFMEAAVTYIEQENAKKAETERRVISGVQKMKSERNDAADVKTFQDFGKNYIIENFGEDCQFKKLIFMDKNWTIFRNSLDKVLSKGITVGYFYKNTKDNQCYFTYALFGYEFDGSTYGSQLVRFQGKSIRLTPEDPDNPTLISPKNAYVFPCENIK